MPRNPKYPLEPLREHRDRHVDAATVQLGEAVRAREAAEKARLDAETDRRNAEARALAVRNAETDRLEGGDLRVADLARAQAWEHAAGNELAELGRSVAKAGDRVSMTTTAESQARAELARKKADLDVVTKDKARFTDRTRKVGEAAEEEAADEVFAARRRGE